MPRRARSIVGGLVYHNVHRANNRLMLFRKPADYEALERGLEEAREQLPLPVLTYNVMANHWHFLGWPPAAFYVVSQGAGRALSDRGPLCRAESAAGESTGLTWRAATYTIVSDEHGPGWPLQKPSHGRVPSKGGRVGKPRRKHREKRGRRGWFNNRLLVDL